MTSRGAHKTVSVLCSPQRHTPTFTGSGIITLLGGVSNEGYYAPHTAISTVTGRGTLQLANPKGHPGNSNPPGSWGSGPLTIKGATVDLYGMSSTVGGPQRRFFRLDHQ